MVTLTLIQGVVNTFVIFSRAYWGTLSTGSSFKTNGEWEWDTSRLYSGQIVFSCWRIIVAWFSRQREFRADSGGADLAGRSKMIGALRRLQYAQAPQPLPRSSSPRLESAAVV